MYATFWQLSYIHQLADEAGFDRWEHAVMAVTGDSISRLQRKGITLRAASETIAGLRDGSIRPADG